MTAAHPLPPEDLMAYLDGEVNGEEARTIQAHLAACDACQQLAADLRNGSLRMKDWRIGNPPASLIAPEWRRSTGRRGSWLFGARAWSLVAGRPLVAGAAVAVLIAIPFVMQSRNKAPRVYATVSGEKPETIVDELQFAERIGGARAFSQNGQGQQGAAGIQGDPAPRVETGPRIIRTATLHVVAADFDRIRPAVDRILQGVGGFIGEITAYDRPGAARVIRGTLRLPSAQFSTALAQLRALGRVTQDSQNAEDVTTAVVDLDVRLTNARVTERRLNQVLQNRTGRVADVLEVEREIARVRTEIEQMTAQRTQLDRRIEYGTVTLEVVEERPAAVTLGTVPVPTRLRHAIADGVESAAMSMLDVLLFVLRAGPLLLLWATVLGVPAWWLVRRHAGRTAQRPGAV